MPPKKDKNVSDDLIKKKEASISNTKRKIVIKKPSPGKTVIKVVKISPKKTTRKQKIIKKKINFTAIDETLKKKEDIDNREPIIKEKLVINVKSPKKEIKNIKCDEGAKRIFLDTQPNMVYPIHVKNTDEFIKTNRKYIYEQIKNKYGDNVIGNTEALKYIYKLYDDVFFMGWISQVMNNNTSLKFMFSKKLTSSAGMCTLRKGCFYTIKISSDIMNKIKQSKSKYSVTGGLKCYDHVECLQLVFEHELCHLIVFLNIKFFKSHYDKNVYSAHGIFFKQLSSSFFGHTEVTHQLLLDIEQIHKNMETIYKINDIITYISHKDPNHKIVARIVKINPKTVLGNTGSKQYKFRRGSFRLATEEEINNFNLINKPIPAPKTHTISLDLNVDKKDLKIGDYIAYFDLKKKELYVDYIVKLNPSYAKTSSGISFRYGTFRLATESEIKKAKVAPTPVLYSNTRPDRSKFNVGDIITYVNSKTGEKTTAKIIKLNPSFAKTFQGSFRYGAFRLANAEEKKNYFLTYESNIGYKIGDIVTYTSKTDPDDVKTARITSFNSDGVVAVNTFGKYKFPVGSFRLADDYEILNFNLANEATFLY